MNTKTLAIAAVVIAATAALALGPILVSSAEARDKTTTQDVPVCTHNGNLRSVDCSAPQHGNSVQEDTVTVTCTGHGNKITCS